MPMSQLILKVCSCAFGAGVVAPAARSVDVFTAVVKRRRSTVRQQPSWSDGLALFAKYDDVGPDLFIVVVRRNHSRSGARGQRSIDRGSVTHCARRKREISCVAFTYYYRGRRVTEKSRREIFNDILTLETPL